MSKTFTAPITGPLTFAVHAAALWLAVITSPDVRAASVELTGPASVVDRARTELSGNRWTLSLPRTPASTGATVIHQSGGSVIVGNITGGSVSIGHGRMIVNGVDITAAAAGPAPEPLRAVVTLPDASSLAAHVAAGQIEVSGSLAAVMAETVSADLRAAGYVAMLDASSVSGDIATGRTGPVLAKTVSGDIRLRHADGAVTAETSSGDITIHAASTVSVRARAISGDVRVTAAPGARPAVTARSVSGDVRTC